MIGFGGAVGVWTKESDKTGHKCVSEDNGWRLAKLIVLPEVNNFGTTSIA